MFVTAGIEDVEQNINKAHRKKSSKKCESIMIKFFSFRYRTKAYRKKKNLDDGVTVHVDLTNKRHSLLRKVIIQ